MRAIERVRLELVTRKFMVMMLAVLATWVGIAMCFTGAPAFMETWFSPWSRYAIGGIAFLGGVATSIGGLMTDRTWRGWWTQVLGLSVLCLWYTGMAVSYLILTIQEGLAVVGPGEPLAPGNSGRGYVVIVYICLVVVTGTPLFTMIRLWRPTVVGGPLEND